MQQDPIFAKDANLTEPDKAVEGMPSAENEATSSPKHKDPNQGQVLTNPMGTEMVVNQQIKVRLKQMKTPTEQKRTATMDSAELIERIKAKLKREFDLTTPVLRNDDDYQKNSKSKPGETGMASFALPINVPPDEELYQKQYYTMGAVSQMFQINQSMLRHWETEFDILKPKKNKKGDRYFRPIDIKNVELIYHLIRNRKFTIEGAKFYIKQHKQRAADTFAAVQSLEKLKTFLTELKAHL